jgi:protein arginine kinase activator
MICQRCGQRDATVHLVELVDGQRKSQWLCAVCAGRSEEDGDGTPGFRFGGNAAEDTSEEDTHSLAAFLGQVFEPQDETAHADLPACPGCGYNFDQFRKTNQLGCPRCYEAFRAPLLSILSHLYRHVSHLGKAPRLTDGGADRPGVLSRTRVALEKAIASEDFERAARLRDEIQRLESAEKPEGTPGT